MTTDADADEKPRLWREENVETFNATVRTAAANLGVQALAVEKDYWVCEALRAIESAFPGDIIFKGGTSLEKMRLIRRFSEDLDILVPGEHGPGNAAKTKIKAMCAVAAESTGGTQSEVKSGGKPGWFWRRSYLNPPLQESATSGAIADANAVLLELGQSGGPHPARRREMTSLLSRELANTDFAVQDYDDLAPFEVAVLHPGRTLLEKLLRVNNFAIDPETADPHGWSRIGRQFYDIWALLDEPEVLELLQDRTAHAAILDSCFDISRQFGDGSGDQPVPDGGFAQCAAFAPDGALRERLEAEHQTAMSGLYYGDDDPPTFDAVLDRVAQCADALDCAPTS